MFSHRLERARRDPLRALLLVAVLFAIAAVLSMAASAVLFAAEVRERPDRRITPGVTRPLSTAAVCSTKWGRDARHVTLAMKRQVFVAYGIPYADHAKYEVDHLISRELAGADDVKNLWPQPWTGTWNAHQKDRLENRLHVLVCRGQLSLHDAQAAIRTDWTAAFTRYVPAPSGKVHAAHRTP